MDVIFLPQLFDDLGRGAHQLSNEGIRKTQLLGHPQGGAVGQTFRQLVLHVHDALDAVDEPDVDLGDGVDLLRSDAAAECLGHHEDPFVINVGQLLVYFVIAQLLQLGQLQRVDVLFQGADSLHQTSLKAVTDGHDLTGGLHLGAQSTAGGGELIKGQAGDF